MPRGKPYLVKIVRDRISEAVPNSTVSYEEIPDEDLAIAIEFLRKKLVEEAVEYALKPELDELADINETIIALASYDLNLGRLAHLKILTASTKKRETRGGFDKLTGFYITADEVENG